MSYFLPVFNIVKDPQSKLVPANTFDISAIVISLTSLSDYFLLNFKRQINSTCHATKKP